MGTKKIKLVRWQKITESDKLKIVLKLIALFLLLFWLLNIRFGVISEGVWLVIICLFIYERHFSTILFNIGDRWTDMMVAISATILGRCIYFYYSEKISFAIFTFVFISALLLFSLRARPLYCNLGKAKSMIRNFHAPIEGYYVSPAEIEDEEKFTDEHPQLAESLNLCAIVLFLGLTSIMLGYLVFGALVLNYVLALLCGVWLSYDIYKLTRKKKLNIDVFKTPDIYSKHKYQVQEAIVSYPVAIATQSNKGFFTGTLLIVGLLFSTIYFSELVSFFTPTNENIIPIIFRSVAPYSIKIGFVFIFTFNLYNITFCIKMFKRLPDFINYWGKHKKKARTNNLPSIPILPWGGVYFYVLVYLMLMFLLLNRPSLFNTHSIFVRSSFNLFYSVLTILLIYAIYSTIKHWQNERKELQQVDNYIYICTGVLPSLSLILVAGHTDINDALIGITLIAILIAIYFYADIHRHLGRIKNKLKRTGYMCIFIEVIMGLISLLTYIYVGLFTAFLALIALTTLPIFYFVLVWRYGNVRPIFERKT